MNIRCNGCGKNTRTNHLVVYGQNDLAFERFYCRTCWQRVSALVMFVTGEWPQDVRTYVRDPMGMV